MNKAELLTDNKELRELNAHYRQVFVLVECFLEDVLDARENFDKVECSATEVRDAELRRAELKRERTPHRTS